MWVSSTRNGEIFHTEYAPLARKQIAAIAHIDEVWRSAVENSVSQAVRELNPGDQVGLSNNGKFYPEPTERYLPSLPEPKLPKQPNIFLLIFQAFVIGMLAILVFHLPSLLFHFEVDSTTFGAVFPWLFWPFLFFYVVMRRKISRRKIDDLRAEYENQESSISAHNELIRNQWAEENNARYQSVVADLQKQLGFNPLDDSIASVWWSGEDPHLISHQLNSFVSKSYRTHPLPDSYIPLLSRPLVRDFRGTNLERSAQVLQEEINSLNIWREKEGGFIEGKGKSDADDLA